MERAEVGEIIKVIVSSYQNFKVDSIKATIDTWSFLLKDADYKNVQENLFEHIKTNVYPPTIAELLKKPKNTSRSVPNFEETQAYLKSRENKQPASEEVRREEAAKVRKILGIKMDGES